MIYLTETQIQQALATASKRTDKYYMLLYTLFSTGLRASEVISLTPQNINFDGNFLFIRGKGNKIRNVDIPAALTIQLQLYIKSRRIKNNQAIFPITRQRVYQIVKELTGVKAHATRHTYAILLLRLTKNIRYVQKQLGHSSLQTTSIYLQFLEYDEEKRKLAGFI